MSFTEHTLEQKKQSGGGGGMGCFHVFVEIAQDEQGRIDGVDLSGSLKNGSYPEISESLFIGLGGYVP
jgi:hypothetical protein